MESELLPLGCRISGFGKIQMKTVEEKWVAVLGAHAREVVR